MISKRDTLSLSHIRIVLVRTHYPGNIGSTARVMANFGLSDLVLVDPIADVNSHDARRLATNGVAILDSAKIVGDLRTALADCHFILATGSLIEGVERQTVVGTIKEKLPLLFDVAQAAIVFGPEPHGLTNAEISLCNGMMYIPTSQDCSSLNLSMAVGICLYELSQIASGFTTTSTKEVLRKKINLATFEETDRLFTHLREAFEAIHYVYGNKADQLMHGFRHIISKAQPTMQEVRLMHGLARQLLFVARKNGILPKQENSAGNVDEEREEQSS